jgi:TrwC relaxase
VFGQKDMFRVMAIPHDVERAFSKRRQAIEEAARVHGYNTPTGMELAALRTRRPKRDAKLGELINHWQAEAKTLGFELGKGHQRRRLIAADTGRSFSSAPGSRFELALATPSPVVATAATNADQDRPARLGSRLGQAIRALDQPAGMTSVRIKLRNRERE